jgi:purine-binding chemotaxis protein CheW
VSQGVSDVDDLLPHEREVLKARRERLRAAVSAEEEALSWLAEFTLGGEPHAFELDRLRAAVPLRAVTPVPLAPPHVIGVLRFEGRPIAALSLGTLLGAERGWAQDPSTLLVLDVGRGRLVAVDCEEVPRPTGVPAGQLALAVKGGLTRQVTVAGPRRLTVIDAVALAARARELARGA